MLLIGLALIAATPASLANVIAAARPGDTIKLAPGDYGSIAIVKRSWSPAIKIRAGSATATSVKIDNSNGVRWSGGTIRGGNALPRGYGFWITQSRNVHLTNIHTFGTRKAVLFDRAQDFSLIGGVISEFKTDGVNVALSQRGLVEGNTFRTSATGTEHPDMIQAWSRPGGITSDIIIRNNTGTGAAQCYTGFNNRKRNGIDDGGFDRMTVTGNICHNSYPHGISFYSCRDCKITGNEVTSLPGAKYKTSVHFFDSTGVACGNKVPDRPKSPEAQPCRN